MRLQSPGTDVVGAPVAHPTLHLVVAIEEEEVVVLGDAIPGEGDLLIRRVGLAEDGGDAVEAALGDNAMGELLSSGAGASLCRVASDVPFTSAAVRSQLLFPDWGSDDDVYLKHSVSYN